MCAIYSGQMQAKRCVVRLTETENLKFCGSRRFADYDSSIAIDENLLSEFTKQQEALMFKSADHTRARRRRRAGRHVDHTPVRAAARRRYR